MRSFLTAVLLGALIACPTAEAMVGTISLSKLIATSDAIVVAQVVRVSGSPDERYATANVLRSLKGPLSEPFRFLASPSWTCDTADAHDGEVVLLFLNRKDGQSFLIAHSGRGRMPLRRAFGKTYVTLVANVVILPPDAPVIPGPDPKVPTIVSLELPFVRALIK